ncbi:FecCD family ABC transporter permease [Shimia sagamensis]|uniref:Iron complex transport system permease protein n=1 Tax=Shimia sagamensis TaxID=1566352 RepID=A0ABY1P120_9RHOB|nr:iron ABC transporter permease [Shimia sagamensis]SMP23400.1 iron complex transport system permease protein [Shimia sagamensis]
MSHSVTAHGAGKLPRGLAVGLALAVLFSGALFSLATGGRSDVGLTDLWAPEGIAATVIYDTRAPRMFAATLLGLNLSLSGLILQAATRNPLASPAILGLNQGAALGLSLGLVLPLFSGVPLQVMALVGAFGAGVVTFAISGGFTGRMDSLRLVLGGVAVGAFSYAMVRFAFTLEDELARSVVRWTVGDITDIRWPAVRRLALWGLPGLFAALALSQRLNLMALGQASAQGLGADSRITLLLGTLIAAALTGVSVSVAGPIAFVGLVVPHLAKLLFGGDHRILVPVSALLGAALMLYADGVSKVLTAPVEAPVGVVVALIGAPWFLWQTVFARDLS